MVDTIDRFNFFLVPYSIPKMKEDMSVDSGWTCSDTNRFRSCNWKKLGRSNDSLFSGQVVAIIDI